MITLSHSDEQGTMADGTRKGDGSAELLKAAGFRWSSVGWIIRNSRWHRLRVDLTALADRLRDAGFEVEVQVDETRAPAAVRAAALDEASDRRAERLDDRAGRLDRESDRLHDQARDMAAHIPFGQPILVGHHSERGDRRYRGRIADTFDRSAATHRDARLAAGGAEAARANKQHRHDAGTIQRRIQRNEAEVRRIDRTLERIPALIERYPGQQHEQWRQRLIADRAGLSDQIEHDRAELAELQDAGVKIWSQADFPAGTVWEVRHGGRWDRVVRANKTTLTLDWTPIFGVQHTGKLSYSKVEDARAVASEAS